MLLLLAFFPLFFLEHMIIIDKPFKIINYETLLSQYGHFLKQCRMMFGLLKLFAVISTVSLL